MTVTFADGTRPGEAVGCDVTRFPLVPDPDHDVARHACCWCMGAVGATVCHAPGHAEAVAATSSP